MDRIVELPRQTRVAVVQPTTLNAEARTVEVVWTTGAPVMRTDFWTGKRYSEVLSLDKSSVDLARLNGGAPLLNTHNSYDLADVVGVVERAWIKDGEGRALVRFSDREQVNPIFNDVKSGIIRNISVGYRVNKYQISEEEGKPDEYRAIDWEPMELSLVPIAADARAGVRADSNTAPCALIPAKPAATEQGASMDVKEQAAATVNPPIDINAERSAAAVAERTRIKDIRACVRVARLVETVADDYIERNVPVDKVREEVINKLAAEDMKVETRSQTNIVLSEDPADVRVRAMTEALLHRFSPGVHKLTELGRPWMGLRLMEMGRMSLEDQGVKTRGVDQMQLAGMIMGNVPLTRGGMHTTSDFPLVLQAVVNKSLRAAYERAPKTFTTVFAQGSLTDFRPAYRNQLGDMDIFEKVNEHGEFKYGSFGESRETIQLATYGKIFAFTRQLLVNDDLNFLARLPAMFGARAADMESDIVWGVVTSNPVMSDGNAYFSAAHGNLAGAGAGPSVATLGAARAAMRVQKASVGGSYLNIQASYLVIPTTLETAIDQLLTQTTPETVANVVPAFVRSLKVVVEPRLDANSATAWYLFADPAGIDTIEYAYLNGNSGVQTETRNGFVIDGTEVRARMDFGAAAIDHRGAYKNPG